MKIIDYNKGIYLELNTSLSTTTIELSWAEMAASIDVFMSVYDLTKEDFISSLLYNEL